MSRHNTKNPHGGGYSRRTTSLKPILAFGMAAAIGTVLVPTAAIFADNNTAKLDLNYNVADNLSLTLSSNEAVVVDGSTAPTTTATVAGNSVYNLVVIDQDNDNAMVNGTGGRIEAAPLTGTTSLTAGTWGIKTAITAGQGTTTLDSTKYYGVPAHVDENSTPLTLMSRESLTDAGIAGDVATITYGVQKKTNQAAGTYADTVIYTVSPMVVPDAYYYKLTGASPSVASTASGTTVTVTSDIPSTSTVTVDSIKLKQTGNSTEYTCTTPTATVEGGFYKFTCTTPATSAGQYDVAINLTIDETTLTMTKASAITTSSNVASIPWMYPTKVLTTGTSDKLVIATNNNNSTTPTTTTVTVGDQSCNNATSVKDASNRWIITCDTPASSAGSKDVTAIMNISGPTYVYNGKAINYTNDTITNRLTSIPETTTGAGNHSMQKINELDTNGPDSSKTFCANSTTPVLGDAVELVPTAILTDERDGQQYTVRKLADGNCWMTENLRYGSTPTNEKRAYQSSDATLSDNIDTTNMANLTDANISLGSASDKCDGYPSMGNFTPKICITDANTENTITNDFNNTKYGVLYNYCAATGGTVCNISSMSADAPGSICPANWKLPAMTDSPSSSDSTSTATKDGTVKSYNNLLNNYNINYKTSSSSEYVKLTTNSLDFVRAGNAYNGSLYLRSASGGGSYWASTANSGGNYAHYLFLSSGFVYRYGYDYRYNGNSVRCVAS